MAQKRPSPAPANASRPTDPATPRTKPDDPLALRSKRAHLRLWLTAGIGFAADVLSKRWALHAIGEPASGPNGAADGAFHPIELVRDYVTLTTQHNDGAVWGVASGRTTLLILASLVALAVLFWLFCSTRSDQSLSHIGLGLLFAGALGNLWDRLFNHGNVIDFIQVDLHVPPANPWPIFNLADALLCVGVGLLLLATLRGARAKPE